MQSKIAPRRILLLVALTGCIPSLVLAFYYFQERYNLPIGKLSNQVRDSAPLIAKTIAPQEKAGLGLPVRLKIPKINVNAGIVYVGLAARGAMDVPKDPAYVAWLSLGPRPGEKGSAVLSGHYGWKNGISAVFDNLYTLRKGDIVSIEDDKGVTISFIVRESRRYDPNADATTVFSSNDGKAHLNLVTCEGVWDPVLRSYSKRLVVFTDKE